mmetsp:Transcript_11821/g.29120  ORF Transcript_11821/g.29120 Transcript_11821/m.29120 type:complete len:226 (-) Transcript_11821:799-1476(-)
MRAAIAPITALEGGRKGSSIKASTLSGEEENGGPDASTPLLPPSSLRATSTTSCRRGKVLRTSAAGSMAWRERGTRRTAPWPEGRRRGMAMGRIGGWTAEKGRWSSARTRMRTGNRTMIRGITLDPRVRQVSSCRTGRSPRQNTPGNSEGPAGWCSSRRGGPPGASTGSTSPRIAGLVSWRKAPSRRIRKISPGTSSRRLSCNAEASGRRGACTTLGTRSRCRIT